MKPKFAHECFSFLGENEMIMIRNTTTTWVKPLVSLEIYHQSLNFEKKGPKITKSGKK